MVREPRDSHIQLAQANQRGDGPWVAALLGLTALALVLIAAAWSMSSPDSLEEVPPSATSQR